MQGGESGGFGEPLIPADEHGGGGVACVLGGESVGARGCCRGCWGEGAIRAFAAIRLGVGRRIRGNCGGVCGGVAGGEVVFFVEAWVVGDVHFAVLAGDLAGGVDHDGGVVVDAGCAFFEEAGGEIDLEFFGKVAECLGGWAGDGLCEVEVGFILDLGEVAGGEEFLGGDELGTLSSGVADHVDGVGEVLLGADVDGTGVLDEAEFEGSLIRHAGALLGL